MHVWEGCDWCTRMQFGYASLHFPTGSLSSPDLSAICCPNPSSHQYIHILAKNRHRVFWLLCNWEKWLGVVTILMALFPEWLHRNVDYYCPNFVAHWQRADKRHRANKPRSRRQTTVKYCPNPQKWFKQDIVFNDTRDCWQKKQEQQGHTPLSHSQKRSCIRKTGLNLKQNGSRFVLLYVESLTLIEKREVVGTFQ